MVNGDLWREADQFITTKAEICLHTLLFSDDEKSLDSLGGMIRLNLANVQLNEESQIISFQNVSY